MNTTQFPNTETSFPARPAFTPLAVDFVRNSCKGFGFGPLEADALTLAAEEIVAYTVSVCGLTDRISLLLNDRIYCLELTVSCQASRVDLSAFNLTWKADSSEEKLGQLGLLLAARMTDRLAITSRGSNLIISVSKERAYPQASVDTLPLGVSPAPPFHTVTPSLEQFRKFASMACNSVCDDIPRFLRFPELAVDMLSAGELGATLLLDQHGSIAGGVCRKQITPRCTEMFGPFLFTARTERTSEELLMNDFLQILSQSETRGVFVRHSPLPLTEKQFNSIGSLVVSDCDGTPHIRHSYYRQIARGSSIMVYSNETVYTWLKAHYERLALPRDIIVNNSQAVKLPEHSAFSVDFKPAEQLATLHLQRSGMDVRGNFHAHLELLTREGIKTIHVAIDNGKPDEVGLAVHLKEAGYSPQVLIPYGGSGDILVFAEEQRNTHA